MTGFGHPDWVKTHDKASWTSPVVTALVDGGATCIGKTVVDELAYGYLPFTHFIAILPWAAHTHTHLSNVSHFRFCLNWNNVYCFWHVLFSVSVEKINIMVHPPIPQHPQKCQVDPPVELLWQWLLILLTSRWVSFLLDSTAYPPSLE